ncbi:hypothetical protein [Bacterioplanoides sp.]|uniref:hypothetical protein n=1 Tax=Bacterioplanoides sp. TaxID=2066072 RepID=UPI003B00340A
MKILLLVACLLGAISANAGTKCYGKVISVMTRSDQCGDNHLLAYFTNSHWFCSISESSASIILSAYAMDKTIETIFSDEVSNVADCNNMSRHFLTPWSIRTVD